VDQDIQEIRTFRVDRIKGEISASKGPADFEAPHGFDLSTLFSETSTRDIAHIEVRKGKATALRVIATSSQSLGHGDDAFIQEPDYLRNLAIEKLEALVRIHG
jgi:proteasome accessory factor B